MSQDNHHNNQEIERKFLVTKLPNIDDDALVIEQGYGCLGDKEEVRLRRIQSNHSGRVRHYLTIKKGEGMVRREYEILLKKVNFVRLWLTTTNRRLQKTRAPGAMKTTR